MSAHGAPIDATLSVTASSVTLRTDGADDVVAAHRGLGPGLVNALHDVRRWRVRAAPIRGAARDLPPEAGFDPGGALSLRHAGKLLSASFLPGAVAPAVAALLRRAEHRTVAVRLAVDAPEFPQLPWEALTEPDSAVPLALHPLVSVYRRAGAAEPAALAGPLRIVVAIGSPDHGAGPLLDYEHELRTVLAAVHAARRNDARVEIVPFATTAAIREALDVAGGVHVLHLSAHGAPGVLYLEDELGRPRQLSADAFLAEAVPPGRMPPVIGLAACYTDVGGEEDGASYAARLARRGACAVIGTQTTVTDRYATRFFAQVYAELARSGTPDVVRAVADARRVVQRELAAASDLADHRLAELDEWSVVTVLAGAPEVSIVDGSAAPLPAPPVRTPQLGGLVARPVGQFVGRRRQLRQLPSTLDSDRRAGLVLHGIGGIGKTALAAEVIRRTVASGPQWRVATLVGPVNVDRILAGICDVLRVELLRRGIGAGPQAAAALTGTRIDVPWPDRLRLLREDLLDDIPVLLTLDNFEDNLVEDTGGGGDPHWTVGDAALAALLADLLTEPARCRILVTSRYRFELPDDAHDRLVFEAVGPLSPAETQKLAWSLPQLDRYLTDEAATERVWRMVGGHPRSLEYLDALLRHGQGEFTDITRRLGKAVTARLGPERAAASLAAERTLDAAGAEVITLAADDILLSEHLAGLRRTPGALDLLIGLSVHREPVGARELEGREHLLALLVDRSLVSHDPGAGTYVMHRWTATELHHRWSRDGHADDLRNAHRAAADHYRRSAGTGIDGVPALEEARYHSTAAGDVDAAADVTEDLCLRLQQAGAWQREADLIRDSLRHFPADSPRRPLFLGQLGVIAYLRGDLAEAQRIGLETLAVLERQGDGTGVASTLHQLGLYAQEQGDYAAAAGFYERSIACSTRHDDPDAAATGRHQLATLALLRGDLAAADRDFRTVLTTFTESGNHAGVANAHHQLGLVARLSGRLDDADLHFRLARTVFEALGDRPGVARELHQLAELAQLLGRPDDAGRGYHESLDINVDIGNEPGAGNTLHQLATLAQELGDDPEAERRYRQALELADRENRLADVAITLHQLGNLQHRRGRFDLAERLHRESLAIKERLGDAIGIAASRHQLGMLAEERGDLGAAERLYREAVATNERLGNRADAATGWSQLGNLATLAGDPIAAVGHHTRAAATRRELGLPQEAYDLKRLARLREDLGEAAFRKAAAP